MFRLVCFTSQEMGLMMNVTVERKTDEIVCTLPDGKQVEIAMFSLSGNDMMQETDLKTAAHLVGQSLNLIGVNSGSYID